MPIDIAAPFERLMNACNDKDFSWWPLVHCRPLSTERFGRRAVAAMAAVTLGWLIVTLVASPAIFLCVVKLLSFHFTIVTYRQYVAALRLMEFSGVLDAVLWASAIGWPLSVAWSKWAWNRRAGRLSRASAETGVDEGEVWPPPPR